MDHGGGRSSILQQATLMLVTLLMSEATHQQIMISEVYNSRRVTYFLLINDAH